MSECSVQMPQLSMHVFKVAVLRFLESRKASDVDAQLEMDFTSRSGVQLVCSDPAGVAV